MSSKSSIVSVTSNNHVEDGEAKELSSMFETRCRITGENDAGILLT